MADDSSRSRTLAAWLQSIAVVLAGGWAIYTFGFKEASRSLHITPSIDVRVLPQPADKAADRPAEKAADSKLRAYELGLSVNNASERDAYLITGLVILYGHKAALVGDAKHIFGTGASTRDVAPQLMMSALEWTADRKVLGATVTFRGFPLSRAEKASQQYVMFAPSGEYDVLEIWAEFHVAEACYGIYPFQRCYEFSGDFKWVGGECKAEETPEGENPCIVFSYRRKGSDRWHEISRTTLQRSFGHRTFQTTRMLVPPDAPILNLPKQPTRP